MAGTLYLVATPIGNLEDMTPRAVRTLNEVDVIAAEDTRGSIKLLNHFDIHTPMTSYHEYNKLSKAHVLVERLLAGENVAVITDAGTPGISDPGEDLVRMALANGITVSPVPGACAAVNALVSSGKATRRFCFEAFLPMEKKERAEILGELKNETRTIVMYEAPHRLVRTLQELLDALGDREITLCRELTKKHETIEETTIAGALRKFGVRVEDAHAQTKAGSQTEKAKTKEDGAFAEAGSQTETAKTKEDGAFDKAETAPRGEYVLVIAGRDRKELQKEKQAALSESMTIEEHFRKYLDQGMDRKEAMKAVAKDRGISKRDVYQQLMT